MKVTQGLLEQDIKVISKKLMTEEYEIPSMWTVVKPAVFVVFLFTLSHFFYSIDLFFTSKKHIDEFALFSVFFGFFLSLLISIAVMSFRANYYSLPKNVRDNSLVFKVFKRKVRVYCFSWVAFNVLTALYLKMTLSGAAFAMCGVEVLSLVITGFVFNTDISRYQLSTLKTIIDAWKGKETVLN